ncbi:36876_t:CDS:2 [Gigaspora margarita]|uniref:36876_t:CDS:1 n=1 Tax=Gigaspora margarita TaxID=4874 RepID=A0ABM8VXK5_GIGMA|nr:36876_t:CDS:2 [Gigaspora margarita]
MPLHIALIVVITSVKNNSLCGNISAIYTWIDDKNPNHKFDMSDVSICILHCMFSVIFNHIPKEVENFIHFGIETIEYNSVTGPSNVRMQMTVLYSSKSIRLQNYLGTSGSNIKLYNAYIISGLIKFSQTDNIKSIITQTPLNHIESTTYSVKSDDINVSKLSKTSSDKMQSNSDIDELANTKDIQNKDKVDTKDIQNEDEDKEEDLQPRK